MADIPIRKMAFEFPEVDVDAVIGHGAAIDTAYLAIPPVPTLVITGSDDGCVDTRLYDSLASSDHLEARRIDGAGHWVRLETPRRRPPPASRLARPELTHPRYKFYSA